MGNVPIPDQDNEKKIINPEGMILPDPEIIAFLAETTGVGQEEIRKTFEPNIYLPDLDAINLCIKEAFGVEYLAQETILIHVQHLIHSNARETSGLERAKNSVKLYFSDKDEFWEKLNYGHLDKRKMIEIGDEIADKFEALIQLLIRQIPFRESNE